MLEFSLEADQPDFLDLFPAGSGLEQLATGFLFTEGPVWNRQQACLYFSDMPGDTRRCWSAERGIEVVRRPSNKCNGMTYGVSGDLYVCEHWTSQLIVEKPGGERQVVASHWDGKELNSPNDVVVRADGSAYFSDPTYGRSPVFGRERVPQLSFRGLYRVDPQGKLHLEAGDFGQVNGLCFSPDESLLYVNDSERAHIRVFEVAPDGSLSNPRTFASDIGNGEFAGGIVDGMKCDELGNVWVTGPRGIWVFSPQGERLGVVVVPEHVGNLAWGGEDWRDLYICASTSIYRLRTAIRGHREAYMTGWDG